ncbi:MAG: dockerin type I domain-containing protein [Patescibacteria group bacterium]|nr:dockerin type I domain-containing protein [Patescibacteria group bacterium]MCL5261760.1 dockerin type I domain-containing protein [Patescibacteria group bacterium]
MVVSYFLSHASMAQATMFPDFPMAFWGSVTIDGVAAPAGTIVRAYYGNVLAGEIILKESGIYGYADSIKQKMLVKSGSGQITFKLKPISGLETEGLVLIIYPQFTSGLTVNKSLSFITQSQAANNINNTGGGGGGGGSLSNSFESSANNATDNTNLSYSKGDANHDGKIDLLDFNTLMVNWNQTEVNNNADFNNDGKVDIFDFNLLMINWTK